MIIACHEGVLILKAPDGIKNHYQIVEYFDGDDIDTEGDNVRHFRPMIKNCEIMCDLLRNYYKDNLIDEEEEIYEIKNYKHLTYLMNRIEDVIEEYEYPQIGDKRKEIRSFIIRLLEGSMDDEEFYRVCKMNFPLIKNEDLNTIEGNIEDCLPHILKPEYIKEYTLEELINLIYNEGEIIRRRMRFDFNITDEYEDEKRNLQGMLKNKQILSTLELFGIFTHVTEYKVSFCRGEFSIGFNLEYGYKINDKKINGYIDDGMYGPITDITENGEFKLENSEDYEFDYYYYNSGAGTVSIIEDLIQMMLFAKEKR